MQKNRHLCTIAQLCRAISSQIRHYRQSKKNFLSSNISPYMSLQYGELRPTSGWGRFVSLGTPANFNGFCFLAALLHSQTAALNRGCHLYSAGRPSRWALAHISSFFWFLRSLHLSSSYVVLNVPYTLYLTSDYAFWYDMIWLLSFSHLVFLTFVCIASCTLYFLLYNLLLIFILWHFVLHVGVRLNSSYLLTVRLQWRVKLFMPTNVW